MIYAVLFRDHGTQTLFETDEIQTATIILHNVATDPAAELIDFSPELDGALDHILYGVRLAGAPDLAVV